MKLSSITLDQIKEILRSQPEFTSLDDWEFKPINVGEMQHKYNLRKGNKVYFVKEVKPHEAQVLFFLYHLDLPRLPSTSFPELLKQKVLVREFIPGEMLKKRKLDLELIKEFALFQNQMNDKSFFDRYNVLGLQNFSLKNDEFSRGYLGSKNFALAKDRLNQLSEMYNLNIIQQFWEILEQLERDKQEVIDNFITMPFARQHHDFREDNIIGKPQKLIDWGSSYGYGPFLFDIAPFLVNDLNSLESFIAVSNNCKNILRKQIDKWIKAALSARFLALLRWHLHPDESRGIMHSEDKCRRFLEYEYQTYKKLLE